MGRKDLTPQEKTALIAWLHGKQQKDIAKEMGVYTVTVGSLVDTAREKIQKSKGCECKCSSK